MAKFENLTISLPADLVEMIRAHVKAGDFFSEGDLISEALQYWMDRHLSDEEVIERVRAEVEKSLNDPRPSRSAEEVWRRLEERHAALVKARDDAA
jgi:antitoxin ParD1/3/4